MLDIAFSNSSPDPGIMMDVDVDWFHDAWGFNQLMNTTRY